MPFSLVNRLKYFLRIIPAGEAGSDAKNWRLHAILREQIEFPINGHI
jgi:hypothetical protein